MNVSDHEGYKLCESLYISYSYSNTARVNYDIFAHESESVLGL